MSTNKSWLAVVLLSTFHGIAMGSKRLISSAFVPGFDQGYFGFKGRNLGVQTIAEGIARRPGQRLAAVARDSVADGKRIVFIRHGCTYMNEYLSECRYGTPGFTDVFSTKEQIKQYKDSPLSPRGVHQAQTLGRRLKDLKKRRPDSHNALSLSPENIDFLMDLDLVVVSPLTRALQTLEIAIMPHIQSVAAVATTASAIPVIALPHAAERLYLISDVGRSRSELKSKFGLLADFDVGFEWQGSHDEPWWFTVDDDASGVQRSTPSGVRQESYKEWRPNGQGQTYACAGEPDDRFDARMISLYKWLEARPESTIAIVCHWGVIDWMLDEEFDNCEMRVVPFREIKPKVLKDIAK